MTDLMRMAEERHYFREPRKCPKEVQQFDRYPEDVTSGHPFGGHAATSTNSKERSALVRRYLHSNAAVLPHPASLRDGADVLQTSRQVPPASQPDPVRTALLVASAFATVLVGGVALNALEIGNDLCQETGTRDLLAES